MARKDDDEQPQTVESPVEEAMQEATEKGYVGSTPDKTPNEAYSVSGVTSGQQTPETQEPGSEGSTKVDPNKRSR